MLGMQELSCINILASSAVRNPVLHRTILNQYYSGQKSQRALLDLSGSFT